MQTTRATRWLAVTAAGLLALTASACSSAATTAAGSTTTAAATTTAPRPGLRADLSVATEHVTYVDTSRTTPAANGNTPELPSRTIQTTIVHPSDAAKGPFALVVLAHGLSGLPQGLTAFATILAAHGYVVLLPRFPRSAGDAPGGSSVADLVNQPGDVRFVLDRFLAHPPKDVAGTFDPDEIGAVGHSLGGATVLGVGAHPKQRDPWVKAIVVLSGVNIGFPNGDLFASGSAPVLFFQGTDDHTLAPGSRSSELYPEAPAPKFLITIVGGTHSGPYEGEHGTSQIGFTAIATADFFDQYLKGADGGTSRMARLVYNSGRLGKLEADPG